MIDATEHLLDKAIECLAGADAEFANKRFNNCANRCYYATLQAAIVALNRAGIVATRRDEWSHAAVPARFDGDLIHRRKAYSPDLRNVLQRNYRLRALADYDTHSVSEVETRRALRRTHEFVSAIRQGPLR